MGSMAGLASTPAEAADGVLTLTGEAPVIRQWNRPHGIALRALGTVPAGAVVRSLSWQWDYPAMPGAVTLRICLADRCLETAERSAFDDRRLAGSGLQGLAADVIPLGPEGKTFGPVAGTPVTLSVEWAAE